MCCPFSWRCCVGTTPPRCRRAQPNPNPNPNPKPNPNPNPTLQERGAGLFDGAVYAGSAGVEVGLVDAIGEISSDMCKRFGRHVQLVNMEPEEPVDYGRLLRWLF